MTGGSHKYQEFPTFDVDTAQELFETRKARRVLRSSVHGYIKSWELFDIVSFRYKREKSPVSPLDTLRQYGPGTLHRKLIKPRITKNPSCLQKLFIYMLTYNPVNSFYETNYKKINGHITLLV